MIGEKHIDRKSRYITIRSIISTTTVREPFFDELKFGKKIINLAEPYEPHRSTPFSLDKNYLILFSFECS